MIYLGIDYGKKYIGLACSDESGVMAFPLHVLKNNKTVINIIEKICSDKSINHIIIGDSVDQKGEKNSIAEDAEKFGKLLKERLNLPLSYEREQFTSAHARHGGSEQKGRIDASAAALILQRFLERTNKA
jgi:putative transcription antitermination factor YqgF